MKKIIVVSAFSVVLFLVLGMGMSLSAQAEVITPVYLENYDLAVESNLHPVYRKVDKSRPIGSTIEKLLNIDIDIYEASIGFASEWTKDHKVELMGVALEDGLLTVELSDPDRFTSGGSYRVRSLRGQIEKSVLQFGEVDEVKFIRPDHLFQP